MAITIYYTQHYCSLYTIKVHTLNSVKYNLLMFEHYFFFYFIVFQCVTLLFTPSPEHGGYCVFLYTVHINARRPKRKKQDYSDTMICVTRGHTETHC